MSIIEQRQYQIGDPCVYCGTVSTSKDHVIPRSLVPASSRKELSWISVPACDTCNSNAKSSRDTALRDLLAIDYRTSGHPAFSSIAAEEYVRALKKGHAKVPPNFQDGIYAPIADNMGNIKEIGWMISIDVSLPVDALNWIARGLVWNAFGWCPKATETKSKFVRRESTQKFDYWLYTLNAPTFAYKLGETYIGVVSPLSNGGYFVVHQFLGQLYAFSFVGPTEPALSINPD